MKIDVQVFGTLRGKLPGDTGQGRGTFELPEAATIEEAFGHLGIPAGVRYVLMVNGKQETDLGRVLQDADKLMILPPVTGGEH